MDPTLPEVIASEAELDEVMTRPSKALVDMIAQVRSPLVVLGAGGKMGPSLAVRAVRAAEAAGHALDVVAVSRFSDAAARQWLEARGVRTLSADLMRRDSLARLPDAHDVLYLVGLKFGTQSDPARTWAVNTLAPAYVAERYPAARLVALSTGNVYPLTPVARGGSVEGDPLTPLGEYANACVARERLFAYFAQTGGPATVLVRLNYAVDLRYGVFVDLGRRLLAGQPIDVTMGYLNAIWQGDANDMILRMLPLATRPARPLNLTGLDVLSVRDVATRLAELLGVSAEIAGQEAPTALLSRAGEAAALLGPPETPLERVLRWTAHWLRQGGPLLGKPTRFEVRDGSY